MSSPQRSWSETTTACASVNCSRYQGSIMAVSSGRPHMFIVYQRGRGQEPVTVAGSIRSCVAVNAISLLSSAFRPILRCRARPRARQLKDLHAVAVRIGDVEALASVVRAADDRHRGRRAWGHSERDQPLVLRLEVVGNEAEVGAAGLVEPAGSAIAAWLLELEQLEVHAVALEMHDADAGGGDSRDLLDEPVRLDLAVGDHLEAEDVAVERERAVCVGAGDREVEDAGDHAADYRGAPGDALRHAPHG